MSPSFPSALLPLVEGGEVKGLGLSLLPSAPKDGHQNTCNRCGSHDTRDNESGPHDSGRDLSLHIPSQVCK